MKIVSSKSCFNSCIKNTHTTKQSKISSKKLDYCNSKIDRNNEKIATLRNKLTYTCSTNKHFSLQHECQELFWGIEDITTENRRLSLRKRNIYMRCGLEWDEEYP